MKFLFFIPIFFLFACKPAKKEIQKTESKDDRLKTEALRLAEGHIKSTLMNPTVSLADANGIFSVSDSLKRYDFDPRSVHIGLIDEDQHTDAIVSVIVYHPNQTVTDEHLIITGKNGNFEIDAVVESNIRVIVINNRRITAEFHTKPRTSIYYQCTKCKRIVDYQFKNDSLIALN